MILSSYISSHDPLACVSDPASLPQLASLAVTFDCNDLMRHQILKHGGQHRTLQSYHTEPD